MLAVRFHCPFSTLYDNQINLPLCISGAMPLEGLKPPTFSEIKIF